MHISERIKKHITVLCVLICCFLCCLEALAAFHGGHGSGGAYHFTGSTEAAGKNDTQTSVTKQETGSGSELSDGRKTVCPTATTTADTGTGALTWTEGDTTYYQFDGKKYVIREDWGVHYLTGFSPESTGSSRTASGCNATSNYTAASTRANLNQVILVKAEGGTGSSAGRNRYDGVYKCQDTGGESVETGSPTTGNAPVVDLFFDTAGEADQVSANGWIFARIYILEEVK